MSGKYSELIQKAREPEIQIDRMPEKPQTREPINQNTDKPETKTEPEVNLCVKVPKSWRIHWSAEAKRHDTTMTAIIVEALTAKFGKPENQ